MSVRWLLLGAGLGLLSLSAGASDWPQFRGRGRDNKVVGFTAPATWPKELAKKWSVNVGDGVSSPALVGDKLYVFTRQGGDEVVTCLNAETGKEVWKEKYACDEVKGVAAGFKGQTKYTGPRSSPSVGEGKVCTFSVTGLVSCFDAATGKIAWQKETKGKPQFYTSTSPLITDGKCIIHVGAGGGKGGGGKGDLIAFDLGNGCREVEVERRWSGLRLPSRGDDPRGQADRTPDRLEPHRRRPRRREVVVENRRSRRRAIRAPHRLSTAILSFAGGRRSPSRSRVTPSKPSGRGGIKHPTT